jgi:hypothetical protein
MAYWYLNSDKTQLIAGDRTIATSCIVRNEINGWRKPNEVIYTTPNHIPFYPRYFPVGIWNVGQPLARTDPYEAPYFIPTDAWQMVPTWVVENGMYVRPTGQQDRDTAYGLHHSTSTSTLGCTKILDVNDLLYLVQLLQTTTEPIILSVAG